ncbi:MAG: hypothetical protein HC879_09830 [Leptolyngbyaceae cyanobacterium SL_5_9]|nr:hypothetical protein [Leptolyngbyaceae cyanobacterium SL_5_9]NJO74826.1 hypothetical protein [Leptolyngbyaceae cyanobacterium RM1_406_9]
MKRWLGIAEKSGLFIGRICSAAIAFVSGLLSLPPQTNALPAAEQPVITVEPGNRLAEFVIEVSQNDIPTAPLDLPTQQERAVTVQMLLDEAWGIGLTTYPQLIEYVKQKSGEGCSRRAIAQWKRERRLLEDAA